MGRKRLIGGWNPRVERRGIPLGPGMVLSLCLGVALVIGVVHNRLRSTGKTDPLVGGLQGLTIPAQTSAAKVSQGSQSLWSSAFHGASLERENQELKRQLDAMRLENENLGLAQAEIARLRGLLGFVERAPQKPLAADVIAWLPSEFEKTITLARGARGKVEEGMAVRTAEGLVGKVVEVGPWTSKVRLLTDADSGVGVRVLGSNAFGILKGIEDTTGGWGRASGAEINYLDRELVIKPGASVVTSGHGGVFPPDIPVGTVESVREDSTHLLKIARVKLKVPMPGDLRQVLILPHFAAKQGQQIGRAHV